MYEIPEDRVEAALSAADEAIQKALSEGGTWGLEEAVAVIALLVTRYACGVATHREGERESGQTDLSFALDFVDMVSASAKKGCEMVLEDTRE